MYVRVYVVLFVSLSVCVGVVRCQCLVRGESPRDLNIRFSEDNIRFSEDNFTYIDRHVTFIPLLRVSDHQSTNAAA